MTRKIASIVVPVDFGTASGSAITLAGRLAIACAVPELQLLHAEQFEVPPYFTPEQIGTLEREREVARTQAIDYLRRFGQTHTRQPFTTAVVEGAAVDVILQAAQNRDLIVMGTHGRRGVSRWWLGSVAERVLRSSQQAVLVVHEGAAELAAEPLVLIAGTGDARDRALQEYGQALATCLHGRWSVTDVEHLADTAAATDASLVVAGSPWPQANPTHMHQAEHLLRVCTRPVLFVPGS